MRMNTCVMQTVTQYNCNRYFFGLTSAKLEIEKFVEDIDDLVYYTIKMF